MQFIPQVDHIHLYNIFYKPLKILHSHEMDIYRFMSAEGAETLLILTEWYTVIIK